GPAPELWERVRRLYEAGDFAAAADRGLELVDAHPGHPDLLFNLACCESLAGRTDDALRHLGQAVELWDGGRDMAERGPACGPIRAEPGFARPPPRGPPARAPARRPGRGGRGGFRAADALAVRDARAVEVGRVAER